MEEVPEVKTELLLPNADELTSEVLHQKESQEENVQTGLNDNAAHQDRVEQNAAIAQELNNTLRDATLQAELRKQQKNEMLRRQFAEKANAVGPWIERQLDAVTAIGMGLHETLEDQLHSLKECEQEVYAYKPHIEELEKIHQAVLESMIFENRGITQQQLNEFRSSFNQFDKNRTGRLTPEEFKSCLVSLGYSIGKDRQGDIDFQRILADANRIGYVDFAAFLAFMTRDSTNTDTAEQVIDSFRILARDKPYILPDELRRQLPPDQAEYCIQRMPPFKGAGGVPGALDYMAFSTARYGQSDL